MAANEIEKPSGDVRYLFSRRVRRLLFYIGLFVLYSQLVSAGLTGVYRYSPWELSFVDGGHPSIFDPWTLTLLQPPEGIGTINDLQAIGWKIEYSPTQYAVWAILPPLFGSAALMFATIARRGWPARCLLFIGSCLGIAAAIVIKLYEWGAGSIGWAWDHGIMTDMTLPNPPHPIYGYAELIGSLFLPIAVYMAIAAFIVVSGLWRLVRTSISAARGRLHPKSHPVQTVDRNQGR
ncbi:MAG: hypothetical protein L0210_03180 [Rhodospirillales bacterium]|nr:hypothetical protein [Rhodospirillales bacterium]